MSSLIVLAAGMSSRYGGLKQLDSMGPSGETILDYSVYDALVAGFDHIVFVIREEIFEEFQKKIGSRFDRKVKVDYAFQKLDDLPESYQLPSGRTKPWGTTHAILAARNWISDSFAVINADDFYGRDAYLRAADFMRTIRSDECAMVAYPMANTLTENGKVNRGICEIQDGLLTGVQEVLRISYGENHKISGEWSDGVQREISESAKVSMNFWIFPKGFMGILKDNFSHFLSMGINDSSECYIPHSVDTLIQQRKITCRVLQTDDSWFGVTYPEDKSTVMSALAGLVETGRYESPLSISSI